MLHGERFSANSEVSAMDELKEIRREPNTQLIVELESLLEDAKSGEVQGLAWVTFYYDERTANGWALKNSGKGLCRGKIATVIGETHMLMTSLSNNFDGIYSDIRWLKGN